MTDSDLDADKEIWAENRRLRQYMIERHYAKVIAQHAGKSSISFYESPTSDDWGTLTLGTWGGYLVQVMPMIFNDRLVLTPVSSPYGYDHGWCFDKGGAAILSALVWNPDTEGEPPGYKKRATAGLRQPGEDAVSEGEVPEWLVQVVGRWGADQPNGG